MPLSVRTGPTRSSCGTRSLPSKTRSGLAATTRPDPAEKAFGARAEVTLKSGEVISDELAVADAHPLGARPFEREQYIGKFTELADGVVDAG